jgi:hypothetical protein
MRLLPLVVWFVACAQPDPVREPEPGQLSLWAGGSGGGGWHTGISDADGDGYDVPADCDDGDDTVHPGAVEIVGDGVDQNCDTDEMCYRDNDNDGTSINSAVLSSDLDCNDSGEEWSGAPEDCADDDPLRSPLLTEIAGNDRDEDCNNHADCYVDDDDDGARTVVVVESADRDCTDPFEGRSGDQLDCNDSASAIRPGATEVAGDGVDQNCDGFETCLTDDDDDGAIGTGTVASVDTDCADPREGQTTDPPDCDDTDDTIRPGVQELVGDGVDQNCDGAESCFSDVDDDDARGSQVIGAGDLDCDDPNEGAASDPPDCNDTDPAVHPGATEVVGDSQDQDCDGDEVCFLDDDDDGARTTTSLPSADADCNDPDEGLLTDPLDCVDTNPAIHPGAAEIAGDGVDQNCDGVDLVVDQDGDGFDTTVDCDDADASVHPSAREVAGDGVDQDCDGAESCLVDQDGDGAVTSDEVPSTDLDCLDPGEGPATGPTDCDDLDPGVRPGVAEGVGDGVDQDCDGSERCYVDGDHDGARTLAEVDSVDLACDAPLRGGPGRRASGLRRRRPGHPARGDGPPGRRRRPGLRRLGRARRRRRRRRLRRGHRLRRRQRRHPPHGDGGAGRRGRPGLRRRRVVLRGPRRGRGRERRGGDERGPVL